MNAPLTSAAHAAITRELFHDLPIDALKTSDSQHQKRRRAQFSKDALKTLAQNIGQVGIQQPITVRPIADAKKFPSHEIVFGERRWLAAKLAGLTMIPTIVRNLSDTEALEVQLVENLQREGEHPLVEAEGYEELMRLKGINADQVADMIGMGRSYVYNRIALLKLSKANREAFYAGDFNASIALLLATIPVADLQDKACKAICREDDPMPFRQAQQFVRDNFMLRLKDAPFPTGDDKLVARAGSCAKCPKRTGNQADLFEAASDSKNPDVCTDPQCFEMKRMAWVGVQIIDAKAKGITVITGPAAKKIKAHEHSRIDGGYQALDDVCQADPKHRTIRQVLGAALKGIPTALVQSPQKKNLIPVIKNTDLAKALKKIKLPTIKAPAGSVRARTAEHARDKKLRTETAVRVAVLQKLHAGMKSPHVDDMRLIAAQFYREIWHENKKRLCRLWNWGDKPLDSIDSQVAKLPPGKVYHLLVDLALNQDVWLAPHAPIAGNPNLFTVARRHGVRVDGVRSQVTAALAKAAAEKAFKKPKPAAKAKAPAKKAKAAKKK